METRAMQLTSLTFETSKVRYRPIMRYVFEDSQTRLVAYRIDTRHHRLRGHFMPEGIDIVEVQTRHAKHLGMNVHDFRYANDQELCAALIGRYFAVTWAYTTSAYMGQESETCATITSFMALETVGQLNLSYNYDESAKPETFPEEKLAVGGSKIRPLLTHIKSLISNGISSIFRKAD